MIKSYDVIKYLFILNFPLIKNPEIKCLMVSTKLLSTTSLTVFSINNNTKMFPASNQHIRKFLINKLTLVQNLSRERRLNEKIHKND